MVILISILNATVKSTSHRTLVEVALSNSRAKDNFLPALCFKISVKNFDIVGEQRSQMLYSSAIWGFSFTRVNCERKGRNLLLTSQSGTKSPPFRLAAAVDITSLPI